MIDIFSLFGAIPSQVKTIAADIESAQPEMLKLLQFAEDLAKIMAVVQPQYAPEIAAGTAIGNAAVSALAAHKTAVAAGADPTQSAITMGATISQAVVASGVVKDPVIVADMQTAAALMPQIGMRG